MKEFDLIEGYFASRGKQRADITLGIGDDCSLLKPAIDKELAVTTDTLVAGIHFFEDIDAFDLGYKSLAVNLSDLAAMGAEPCWASLALTLPDANHKWLEAFSRGLFELLDQYKIALIGGDITHGPLSVTITAFGTTPKGKAILRNGAKPGDYIYVTGSLGDAGFALQQMKNNQKTAKDFYQALVHPKPRIEDGIALRDIATAMIDISDGLAADLGHILEQSKVGATIHLDLLPISNTLKQQLPPEQTWHLAISAGDDYQLCFSAPKHKKVNHHTKIGTITTNPGLQILDHNKKPFKTNRLGYEHSWNPVMPSTFTLITN